jgi:hypothetical protein
MKKLLAAAMMLASGMVFGQQDQNTGKTEGTQPAAAKQTDVSSETIKDKKDAGSIEGKSFKIKFTARTGSEKNTASVSGNVSGTKMADEGNKNQNGENLSQPVNSSSTGNTEITTGSASKDNTANPQNPAATSSAQQTAEQNKNQSNVNPSQQTETQKPVEAQNVIKEYTTPQDNSSVSKKEELVEQKSAESINQNQNNVSSSQQLETQKPVETQILKEENAMPRDKSAVIQKDAGNQSNTASANQPSSGQVSELPTENPVAMPSYDDKTIVITLKNGTVDISGEDDMKFESCPYQVTSGSGSLVTFTASCKSSESGSAVWWSGFIDGNSIRGSLLTKAAVGESTDYTFKGIKTSAAKKRVHEKETSLR